MTLLERLKELETTRGRADGEDLAHWADRNKDENLWVRDIALPLLLEVAEAAREHTSHYSARSLGRLNRALAKLEAPDED